MAHTYCDDCNKTHTALMCFNKPRKPARQVGKKGQKWLAVRREWIKNNPPDHSGYWYCYYCQCALTYDTLTIDHVIARSRRPDLQYDLSNLVPSCSMDNNLKGSLSAEEYLNKLSQYSTEK
jgi:5-methylcytosine-specific restriction endonuclease McrA